MPSALQKEILAAVQAVMHPIVRFLIRAGIGFREFSRICKVVFVQVATEDYGIRGRPTNISRVAVMTGLTRKEVKAIRDNGHNQRGFDLWDGKLNPPTEILHHWHSDPDFCDARGVPKALSFAGDFPSFTDLVRRYAGDIPPGAMRVELRRADAIETTNGNYIRPKKAYYTPTEFDKKFVRSMSFSLSNLAETLVHNAKIHSNGGGEALRDGRFERYVWTSRLSQADLEEFRLLAERKCAALLSELDEWIGEREQRFEVNNAAGHAVSGTSTEPGVGVGVYYFKAN